jgi:predicted ATPase
MEAMEALGRAGLTSFTGAASSVGSTSYVVWQDIWTNLLDLKPNGDPESDASRALAEADPELLPRLPLLAPILGIPIEDNELTRSFEAKLRKESLESLLVQYLTHRAKREPLVLVLEDCHWIDGLSSDLLDAVSRVVSSLPLLVLLTYRPGGFSAETLPNSTVIALDRLDQASSQEVLGSRLAEVYGPEAVAPESLLDRLSELADGNPFYLEELVQYIHAHGVDITDKTSATSVELPDSLATLVLSRIDMLAESPRQTLKVASVVGRQFGVNILVGAHPNLGGKRKVVGNLRRLCTEDLVLPEDSASLSYAFKHAVIREVAYDSLPFAQRAVLHGGIGSWLETAEPESLDLLAHHFWFSGDDDKKREYLVRAGDAAQARYANDAAIDYFRRAAPLLPDRDRIAVLMKLGAVLEHTGDWTQAEAAFSDALALADALADDAAAARARTARADPIRRQGRFELAIAELETAARIFESLGDAAGLGRVAHLRGTIAAQTGDYAEAVEQYERSLEIRVSLGDRRSEASVLSNLAIVAEYNEDYQQAKALNEQALALRTDIGDRWGIGVSRNNLGMISYLLADYLAARDHLEEALRIEMEVGDTWMMAIARHNLGNASRELQDHAAAGRNYSDALRTYSIAGDRWAECLLLEDIAMMAAPSNPRAALQLIGAADAMREEIGSPRVAAQQTELNARFDPIRTHLGADAPAQEAKGRGLDAEAALRLALDLCSIENVEASN